MAFYDSADLLLRLKRLLVRPSVDQAPAPDAAMDTTLYSFLEEAQLHWTRELATHVPESMYIFEKLTTADSGVSYDFSGEPLGEYELRRTPTGALMIPCPEWEQGGDYVPAGQKIRFPGQLARTFANGPWARYVKMPTVLDATHDPTLLPVHARQLLVPRAAVYFATRGGLRDPKPYQDLEDELWYGNAERGEVGILGSLKTQAFLQGAAAVSGLTSADWWRTISTGEGYVRGTG